MEVSAYPAPGDTGDNWKLSCATRGAKVWIREEPVRLVHVESGKYLGAAANYKYGNPIAGQLEVAGYAGGSTGQR
ncbi:hypothetical protein HDU93_004851 [Gonapodya sp. JEL0774]|nr:hypothetical protein HDU93_004851 [Gonapodya sp. JEL0774]